MSINSQINFAQKDEEQLTSIYWLPEHVDYSIVLMDLGEKRVYSPFENWLKDKSIGEKDKGYHLEHCQFLIDYLACEEGIAVWDITYRALINFIYNYYPSKVIAKNSQREKLIPSIELLITFMHEQGFELKISSESLKLKESV